MYAGAALRHRQEERFTLSASIHGNPELFQSSHRYCRWYLKMSYGFCHAQAASAQTFSTPLSWKAVRFILSSPHEIGKTRCCCHEWVCGIKATLQTHLGMFQSSQHARFWELRWNSEIIFPLQLHSNCFGLICLQNGEELMHERCCSALHGPWKVAGSRQGLSPWWTSDLSKKYSCPECVDTLIRSKFREMDRLFCIFIRKCFTHVTCSNYVCARLSLNGSIWAGMRSCYTTFDMCLWLL